MLNNTNIDFIKIKKVPFTISICIVLITLVSIFTLGLRLDIQFKGGSLITYSYENLINREEVQNKLQSAINKSANVQELKDINTNNNNVVISVPTSLKSDEILNLTKVLNDNYLDNKFKCVQISNINPNMGKEFLYKCLVAVATVLILMILFITVRFRKIGGVSGGITAVIALLHDVIIVFGVFIFLKYPINDNFIAVILTIIGYSINDTIVIYDRIRENRRLLDNLPIYEIVNVSINQSFKRTVNTTLTTVISVGVMYVIAICYNISAIKTFALPMMAGMISGVYSSICIAGPLWATWQNNKAVAVEG